MTVKKALTLLLIICMSACYYINKTHKEDSMVLVEEIQALTAECEKERLNNRALLKILKAHGIYADTTTNTPALIIPNYKPTRGVQKVQVKTKKIPSYYTLFL